jgi:arylsulfatase A-like enzyme
MILGFLSLVAFTTSLGADEWEPQKTHALIVGVLEWKNGLSPFPKRNRKDKELRDLLIQRGTPAENVTLLLGQEATLPKIREALAHTLSKTSKDSTLIIYYDGHGWAAGDDFCFANYDVQSGIKNTAWSVNELAATVTKDFKGQRAFFWADCCYSGGLQVIVDKLARRNVASFSLTSASTQNVSTRNWTFTQSLIDGLSGAPLIDTNGDGLITLGELRTEVRDAMNHLEGQKNGFKSNGIADTFVLAKASGRPAKIPKAKYHVGTYVKAKEAYGRVVSVKGVNADEYSVQFYNYTEKIVKQYAVEDLVASTRKPAKPRPRGPTVARSRPDCKVEWRGSWYDAKVLKTKNDRWYIHYVDDDHSWDEWVGKDRIRLNKSAPGGAKADVRPNVIFILADDLGWKDVGFAGASFFETPHIDRLAGQGMTFTAAYSGGPNCAPTRACFMSGTYTPRHHIYTPGGKSKGNTKYMRLLVPARGRKNKSLERKAAAQFPIRNALDPKFVCIPEVLAPSGYTSARLGKWHLGEDTQGFDLSSANGKGGPAGKFYGNVDVAAKLTDRAVEFIEHNRKGPFFLFLSHWDVHSPHRARRAVVEKYKTKLSKLSEAERRNFKPVYAAMIAAVDSSVGRVVAKVDELGIAKNTVIIFSSDNGGLPKVSQLAPLRGQKGSLFEAGVRVPTCVRWTGSIEPGSTCGTPITSVDFLPTFASLAGAKLPTSQPIDGRDISPLFRGAGIDERSIFWHYPLYLSGKGLTIEVPKGKTYSWRGFPSSSLRRGEWKLVEFHESDTVALFHLGKDPGEERDLAASMPELTAKLRAELDAWQAETKAPIPRQPNPECVLVGDGSRK